MPASLISVIGPPASGKTTLAELLAEELPATLLREDYAGNPFLAGSYLGDRRFALQSQLYFLFSRLAQLNCQRWPAEGVFVTDYGFCQDAVYAAASLPAADMALYRRLAAGAGETVKPPDVLVALAGRVELLLERIDRRGRGFERSFTGGFLNGLARAYDAIVADCPCPVIELDVGKVDITAPEAGAGLLRRIREVLG